MHAAPVIAVLLAAAVRPGAVSAASTDITLATPSGALYGTLELPEETAKRVPVALIVAGSGPTDRNGNSGLGITANGYGLLADALAALGIASVRYDKRGVAASAGASPMPLSSLTFDMYVDDAARWVRFLRDDPRFSRVAIVGHSEGALVAVLAAQQSPTAAVVSVAGVGRPIGDAIVAQIAARGPQAAALVAPARDAVTALKAGHAPPNVPPALASLFPPYLQTFWTQWLNIDPTAAARALTVPFAVVQGTADVQVSVDDARLLSGANPHAVLTIVPHMTHMLKDAAVDSRAASLATYANPSAPLDATAVAAIAAGITAP